MSRIALIIVLTAASASAAPADLDAAIAAFRSGDCATALARAAGLGSDAHAMLWKAGIAQRCGDEPRARQLVEQLLARDPAVEVDLGEFWPSLAELVDARRPSPSPSPPPSPSPSPSPSRSPSPSPSIALGAELIAAGREVHQPTAHGTWQGSGLGLRATLGSAVFAEVDARLVVYPDANQDARAGGGWEWGTELHGGVATGFLHDRLRLAALAFAMADGYALASTTMPGMRATGLAAGFAGRIQLVPARAWSTFAELGWAPLGTLTRMETPTRVTTRFALAWRATTAWQLVGRVDWDTIQSDFEEHDVVRFSLALHYQR